MRNALLQRYVALFLYFFLLFSLHKKTYKRKSNLMYMCDTEALFIIMVCLLPWWQLALNFPILKKSRPQY